MSKTNTISKRDFNGLCFINLVDFDMTYGHRNDVAGYARALTAFDAWLGEFIPTLREDDLLIITGDHGCDPSTPSTDHSREYTPMLAYGKKICKNKNLGTRNSFADIGATILEYFGLPTNEIAGESFLKEITND
jgi:phosphopentomutase